MKFFKNFIFATIVLFLLTSITLTSNLLAVDSDAIRLQDGKLIIDLTQVNFVHQDTRKEIKGTNLGTKQIVMTGDFDQQWTGDGGIEATMQGNEAIFDLAGKDFTKKCTEAQRLQVRVKGDKYWLKLEEHLFNPLVIMTMDTETSQPVPVIGIYNNGLGIEPFKTSQKGIGKKFMPAKSGCREKD